MLDNQRGGVISKVFIIPVGVVVIIAVFVAGYFVGKRQGIKTAGAEKPPALPEVLSQYVPNKAEFTFYNTLTDKGEKTVSIDLMPKAKPEPSAPEKGGEAPRKAPERPAPKAEAQKPPERTAKKEPAPKAEQSKVRYSIQVGSYEDKAMAEDEVRNMKQRGYAAFIVASDIPDKGTWYRVRVGSFSNKAAAEKLSKELQAKEGISSFISTE
jgi:cell division septation protein DedD